jgi:hypothetical protein
LKMRRAVAAVAVGIWATQSVVQAAPKAQHHVHSRGQCEDGCGRAQARVLKRQLALPVSTMSQWWVSRSSSAVVILASPAAGRELVELFPTFVANIDAELRKRNLSPRDRAHILDGLRKAGVPLAGA